LDARRPGNQVDHICRQAGAAISKVVQCGSILEEQVEHTLPRQDFSLRGRDGHEMAAVSRDLRQDEL
jgi:hypothetical protein